MHPIPTLNTGGLKIKVSRETFLISWEQNIFNCSKGAMTRIAIESILFFASLYPWEKLESYNFDFKIFFDLIHTSTDFAPSEIRFKSPA